MCITLNEISNMYPEHRFIMSNLEKILDKFTSKFRCVVIREAKYEWKEFPNEKFEPDISILCGLRHRKGLCYTDIPRFIAEILSDSTEKRDRKIKMNIYAAVGVQEYWIVDWRKPGGSVERYMLNDEGNKYILHDIINGSINIDKTIRDEENKNVVLNIISFPNWTFTMYDLMLHIGEEEIME